MKPKTIVLMVVAVGCGLVASYMTSQLLAERGSGQDQTEEKIKILVAKKNLDLGLLIDKPERLFKVKLYLKGQEPEKALTDADFDKLRDRRLLKPLKTDEFVTAADLIDKNQNSLSARLPKGMRAVGIKVNVESIAGGFASLPMSHVDIISVLRRGDNDSISQILLEDVLVLAADQEINRPGDGKSAMVANTVTVALTPDDAELVTLAQEMGSLRLILRAFGDSSPAGTRGANGTTITKGQVAREKLKAARAREDYSPSETGRAWLRKVTEVRQSAAKKTAPAAGKPEPKPAEVVKTTTPPTVGKPAEAVKPLQKPVEVKKTDPEESDPELKTHTLTIYNGNEGRRYYYKLDEKGAVVVDE
jgi:pilus assembly protein CpaB